MKYVSTRDIGALPQTKTLYTFEEALFHGYAPLDGGLFVPFLNNEDLKIQNWKELSSLSYSKLMFAVLKEFISHDEIPSKDLQSICNNALKQQTSVVVVGSGDDDDNNTEESAEDIPIPVVRIPSSTLSRSDSSSSKEEAPSAVFVGELYHGPTYCFKDFSLRVVIGLMGYFASRRQSKLTLVVATTGDTGPAAVQAVQDLSSTSTSSNSNNDSNLLSIIVHYPKGQISEFQQKQLTIPACKSGNNIKVVEFEGGGDDMDIPIKNIMKKMNSNNNNNANDNNASQDNIKRYVCGINSYNIGRPLVQMVHFIWIYLRVVEQLGIEPGDKDFLLDIVIPTGAMGNLAGAYMAKKILGLPLGKLNAGCNVNDFTNTMFTTGNIIVKKSNEIMKQTLSEAINIQLPYNLERILFYLTESNYQLIHDWYTKLEKEEAEVENSTNTATTTKVVVDIGSDWLSKLRTEFDSARITDEELCKTQQHVYKNWDDDGNYYLVDPHTGVAICAANKLGYININDDHVDDDDDNRMSGAATAAVAIIATASPCKFQEAMTIALGKEVWDEYTKSTLFPQSGLDLINDNNASSSDDDDGQTTTTTTSKNLHYYKFNPSKTLEENQIEWERLSTNIIYNEL